MLSENLVKVEVSRIGSRFSSRISNESSEIEMFCNLHCLVGTHAICFRSHFKHLDCIKTLRL